MKQIISPFLYGCKDTAYAYRRCQFACCLLLLLCRSFLRCSVVMYKIIHYLLFGHINLVRIFNKRGMYGCQGMFMYKIIYYLLFEHLNSHANISSLSILNLIQPRFRFRERVEFRLFKTICYHKHQRTTSFDASLPFLNPNTAHPRLLLPIQVVVVLTVSRSHT